MASLITEFSPPVSFPVGFSPPSTTSEDSSSESGSPAEMARRVKETDQSALVPLSSIALSAKRLSGEAVIPYMLSFSDPVSRLNFVIAFPLLAGHMTTSINTYELPLLRNLTPEHATVYARVFGSIGDVFQQREEPLCRLREVDLSGAPVTDVDLGAIANAKLGKHCPNLLHLQFNAFENTTEIGIDNLTDTLGERVIIADGFSDSHGKVIVDALKARNLCSNRTLSFLNYYNHALPANQRKMGNLDLFKQGRAALKKIAELLQNPDISEGRKVKILRRINKIAEKTLTKITAGKDTHYGANKLQRLADNPPAEDTHCSVM